MAINKRSRRDFLKLAVAAGVAATIGDLTGDSDVAAQTRRSPAGIPTRPLGDTGVRVPILCLGGWHIGAVSDSREAIHIMHAAIDEGVTFFDNAWDYHDGRSEELMGMALKQGKKRDRVFLMTKNCGRDYATSVKHLNDSLSRLKTDHIDLWQFHEINYDNDPEWIFDRGALKAALEAQKAGKVRFIGFTGHKDPRIHLAMLSMPYHWASSQMPINVMDAHYRSFQKEVVPVCLKKKVGVLGMKSLGGSSPRGIIPERSGVSARDCLRFALSQPISSLVVGIMSREDLRQDVAIARELQPMTEAERVALLNRVRDIASDGRYELFKSSKMFDGPYHCKQHGFSDFS